MNNNFKITFLLTVTVFLAFTVTVLHLNDIDTAQATGGAFTATKHGGDTTVDSGVWCGSPPCGVDRSLGGEVAYHFNATEAGKFKPGECNQCHDLHASFGGQGIEAKPNATNVENPDDAGPDNYLLMREYNDTFNYANLCWYCHENMALGFPPQFGTGYWNFYQGKTNFQASSHWVSNSFNWPGTEAADIYPREARSGAGNQGSCLNCHTPHGIAGTYDADGTAASATNYATGGSVAATAVIDRQLIAREEALCLRCHDGSSAAGAGGVAGPANAGGVITTNIKEQVDMALLAADGSGHPVRTDFATHNLSETPTTVAGGKGWLNTAGAHAECTDCHNPHRVEGYGSAPGSYPNPNRGTVYQPSGGSVSYNTNRGGVDTTNGGNPISISSVNQGVWGVSINTTTGEVDGIIDSLNPATDAVYNLCFKCHSAWAWNETAGNNANQPNSPSTAKTFTGSFMPSSANGAVLRMTDVAFQFINNTATNDAWHPVYGIGRNQPAVGANPDWSAGPGRIAGVPADLSQNFVPPWRGDSIITCVDCHEADDISSDGTIARGPHGSSRPFILRKLDTTISYTVTTGGNFTTSGAVNYNGSLPTCGSPGSGKGASLPACGSDRGTDDVDLSSATREPGSNEIFCLNCHRADVYGFNGAGSSSKVPYFYVFPRQPHPVDWNTGGKRTLDPNIGRGDPPRGIICLRCHGGGSDIVTGANMLGNIHGLQSGLTSSPAGGTAGRAFIGGGAVWTGYEPGNTTTDMTCYPSKDDAYGDCGQHGSTSAGGSQGSGTSTNYNYTP